MKKQMPLRTLVDSVSALNELAALKLKPIVAFKVARLIQDLNGHLRAFEEAKRKAFETYGVPDEKEGMVIPLDKQPEFMSEMDEVVSQEITFNIPSLTINELGDVAISPGVLASLIWLFDQTV